MYLASGGYEDGAGSEGLGETTQATVPKSCKSIDRAIEQ